MDSRILDAACGSGLTGIALKNLGFRNIDGIDISAGLLQLADQTGAYTRLDKVDMQVFPLLFEDGEFDAVNFIGALTYSETNEILRELCQIVRSGGFVVFSQGDDIMHDNDCGQKLEELERDGLDPAGGSGAASPQRVRVSAAWHCVSDGGAQRPYRRSPGPGCRT
jgi:predicted TPR repeat methyltransferase